MLLQTLLVCALMNHNKKHRLHNNPVNLTIVGLVTIRAIARHTTEIFDNIIVTRRTLWFSGKFIVLWFCP